MVTLLIDLDDDLYEVFAAIAREHGRSVEDEISGLLSEVGWREQAALVEVRLRAELAGEHSLPAPCRADA